MAHSSFGCEYVQKKVCFAITALPHRPAVGFTQKVTIFGILMSLAADGYLSPPLLAGREGCSRSMWQTFPVIVYVALYCLHKLKVKGVLSWHQFSGLSSESRQAPSDFIKT